MNPLFPKPAAHAVTFLGHFHGVDVWTDKDEGTPAVGFTLATADEADTWFAADFRDEDYKYVIAGETEKWVTEEAFLAIKTLAKMIL